MRHAVRRLIEAFARQKWVLPAGYKSVVVSRQPAGWGHMQGCVVLETRDGRQGWGKHTCRRSLLGAGGRAQGRRCARRGMRCRAACSQTVGQMIRVQFGIEACGGIHARAPGPAQRRSPRGLKKDPSHAGRGQRGDAGTAAVGTGKIPELVSFGGEGDRPFLLDQPARMGTTFVHSLAKDGKGRNKRRAAAVQQGQMETLGAGQPAPVKAACCCRATQGVGSRWLAMGASGRAHTGQWASGTSADGWEEGKA